MSSATEQEPQSEAYELKDLWGSVKFNAGSISRAPMPENPKSFLPYRAFAAAYFIEKAMIADEVRRYMETGTAECDLVELWVGDTLGEMADCGIGTFDGYIAQCFYWALGYMMRGSEAYSTDEPSVWYVLERWRHGHNVEARLELADTLSRGKNIDERLNALLRQEAASWPKEKTNA
jgi:hypothetical protein